MDRYGLRPKMKEGAGKITVIDCKFLQAQYNQHTIEESE